MGDFFGDLVKGVEGLFGLNGGNGADPLSNFIQGVGDFLHLPKEITDAGKVVAGVVTGDVVCAATGGLDLASRAGFVSAPPPVEYHPSSNPQVSGCGYFVPPPPPGPCGAPVGQPRAGSGLDPDVYAYRDALNTLQANFETFDAASSRDGKISLGELRHVANDPSASPKLRQAAQFILGHDLYRNRLETQPNVLGAPRPELGYISTSDVSRELAATNAQMAQYGGSAGPVATAPGVMPPSSSSYAPSGYPMPGSIGVGSAGASSGMNPMQGLCWDQGMSTDEKVMMILQNAYGQLDNQMNDLANQLADAQTRSGSTDQKTAQGGQRDAQMLQFKLQQVMERRTQMFTLMSTLANNENEMAKTALQFAGRA